MKKTQKDYRDLYKKVLFEVINEKERDYQIDTRQRDFSFFSTLLKQYLPYVTTAYAIVIAIVFLSSIYDKTSLFSRLNRTEDVRMSELRQEMDVMSSKYNNLVSYISTAGAKLNDSDTKLQISQLETRLDALSQTVLFDPDKALTSRLLREKQLYIDNQMSYLRDEQTTLKNTLTTLIVTVIGTPLVTLALPFVFKRQINADATKKPKINILKKKSD